jgi:hypothetical protein
MLLRLPPRLPFLPPLFSAITPLIIAARIFFTIGSPSILKGGIKGVLNLILPNLDTFILSAFLLFPLLLFLFTLYIIKIIPFLFIN